MGGTGYGVPFPGSKGNRSIYLQSFRYANLASWSTQDTVFINEWGGGNEHNKNRRGLVAFGAVSDPAAVPAAGTASYAGVAYGKYAGNASDEPVSFVGTATATVNFTTREVVVTLTGTVTDDALRTPVPAGLRAVATMGAAGTNVANYLTGPAGNAGLSGGLSGRHFGPVPTSGSSGQGPAELGGAFSLSNTTTGAVAIGGFIARKQ